MSIWEYSAAVAAVLRAKGVGQDEMNDETEEALWAVLQDRYGH